MQPRSLLIYLFPLSLPLATLNADVAETPAAPPAISSEGNPGNSGLRTGLVVSGGCVGGAVIGTVVPIFGNLVGCALGGLAGWWFGRDRSTLVAKHPPTPL